MLVLVFTLLIQLQVRIISAAVDDSVREIWREEGSGGRKDWWVV